MDHITTITELKDSLDEASPEERAGILKKLRIPAEDFLHYASWENKDYTRNCVEENENYELILLCWNVDAQTAIHDHGGRDCWVHMIEGSLEENRYVQDENGKLMRNHNMILSEGALTYMHDRMGYHDIKNLSGKRAMTLHCYAKPIVSCNVYNESEQKFEHVEMEYATVDGVAID